MKSLTVASFNTFGVALNSIGSRYPFLAKYFNHSDVDIINLQEVFTYFNLELLRRLLHQYPYFEYEKAFGGPRGGLVTFSKLPLYGKKFINYKRKHIPYFVKFLSLGEVITRRGLLITNISGSDIVNINTHLTPVQTMDWTSNSDYYLELLDEIEQFHYVLINMPNSGAIIISGDFNIARSSLLFKKLVELDGLVDLFKQNHEPTFHAELLPKNQAPFAIDYIFLFTRNSKIQSVLKARHIFKDKVVFGNKSKGFVSDHIGLQITLLFKNTPFSKCLK